MDTVLSETQDLHCNSGQRMDQPVDDLGQLLGRMDAAALRVVYDRTAPVLYGAALRMTEDEERACAVLKTVFHDIQQPGSGYTPDHGRPLLWLLGRVHAAACALLLGSCTDVGTLPLNEQGSEWHVPLLLRCYALSTGAAEDMKTEDQAMVRQVRLNNLSRYLQR